jgi:hypothetical protein
MACGRSSVDDGKRLRAGSRVPAEPPAVLPNRINVDTVAFMTGRLRGAAPEAVQKLLFE